MVIGSIWRFMKKKEWINQFDSKMQAIIDAYVQEQDFHAIETPLKSDSQIKNELRARLHKEQNFDTIFKGIFNSFSLINAHLLTLNDKNKKKQIRDELDHALTVFSDLRKQTSQESKNQSNTNAPLWVGLYGISDETLLMIYDIVLENVKHNQINNAKDLLQILLLFAPTITSFWNALGFCFQTEGNYDQALNIYLISEEINPELPDTHFYLVRCYMAMHEKSRAQEQVKKLNKLIAESKELKGHWKNEVEQLAQEYEININ